MEINLLLGILLFFICFFYILCSKHIKEDKYIKDTVISTMLFVFGILWFTIQFNYNKRLKTLENKVEQMEILYKKK